MINIQIRNKDFCNSYFIGNVKCESDANILCELNSHDRLMQELFLQNYRPGLLQSLKINVEVDTQGIFLCPENSITACQEKAQKHSINVPSLPQSYWKGDANTIKFRVCISDKFKHVDFNISTEIIPSVRYRDSEFNPNDIQSSLLNVYVKVI
jgi:hypothetical protein